MARMHARAAAIATVCTVLAVMPAPAAAQQDHNGVPASGAQVVLRGTARCAGTPSGGAVVRLFHGSAADRHLVAAAVADAAGRFAVRVGAGTYTLEFRVADATFTQESRRRTARPRRMHQSIRRAPPGSSDAVT